MAAAWTDGQGLSSILAAIRAGRPARPTPKNSFNRDWAMPLGAGGTVGTAMFPAKFSFDINAAPSCTSDFVVYNTSLTGASPE